MPCWPRSRLSTHKICLYSARLVRPALQVSSTSRYGKTPGKAADDTFATPAVSLEKRGLPCKATPSPSNIESYRFSSSEGGVLRKVGTAAALIPPQLAINPLSLSAPIRKSLTPQVQRPQLTQSNKMAPPLPRTQTSENLPGERSTQTDAS